MLSGRSSHGATVVSPSERSACVLALKSVQRLPGQIALSVIVSLSDMVVMNFSPCASSSVRRAKSIALMSASPVAIIAMRLVISGTCTTTNLPMCGGSIQWSGTAWTSPRLFGSQSPMVNGPEPTGTSLMASAPTAS